MGAYNAISKSKITMAYYFVEDELSPLITLAASPSNAISDDAFITKTLKLMKKHNELKHTIIRYAVSRCSSHNMRYCNIAIPVMV